MNFINIRLSVKKYQQHFQNKIIFKGKKKIHIGLSCMNIFSDVKLINLRLEQCKDRIVKRVSNLKKTTFH